MIRNVTCIDGCNDLMKLECCSMPSGFDVDVLMMECGYREVMDIASAYWLDGLLLPIQGFVLWSS
jgi:hypothetical protein